MLLKLNTQREIKEALKGRTIRSVEFGDWDREGGETSSIALHLDNGTSVIVSATTWSKLAIEVS